MPFLKAEVVLDPNVYSSLIRSTKTAVATPAATFVRHLAQGCACLCLSSPCISLEEFQQGMRRVCIFLSTYREASMTYRSQGRLGGEVSLRSRGCAGHQPHVAR